MTLNQSPLLLIPVLCLFAGPLAAAEPADNRFTGTPEGQVLVAADSRVVVVAPTGQIAWEYKSDGLVHDAWKLPDGNVLLGNGRSVTEVAADKRVVWRFQSDSGRGDATYACQRLPDGRTLVGENSTGRILEVDRAGKVVFTLQTQPFTRNAHGNQRLARKLDNGNYLVCHKDARLVKEYKPTGEVVQELRLPDAAFSAIRTPQGTTVVGCISRVMEFDRAGKRVWEFDAKADAAGVAIGAITGVHLLPGGNLVLGIYSANTKDGKGCNFLEISREKKIVWRYCDAKFAHSSMAVQMLDAEGKALPGVTLR